MRPGRWWSERERSERPDSSRSQEPGRPRPRPTTWSHRTWIFFFFDLCSLFCLSRGSARAQLRSSVPRWDSNHLILIQYWLQFCSQSGLFNYLAAVRNVLILHLVSFRESELQHEAFELWLPYLDLGQEDQRSINKYVFQDCIKSCEDTYSYT